MFSLILTLALSAAPAAAADGDGDGYDAIDDCDDSDETVYPGAGELCDGIYNDCDDPSYTSSGAPDDEVDDDGDRFVACGYTAGVWQGAPSVVGGEDCDDSDETVYPGADEVCDGVFNDCEDVDYDDSGAPDEESDDDGDGYVECDYNIKSWMGAAVDGGGDCDDASSDVHPGAVETCERNIQIDSDCNGDVNSADGFSTVANPLVGLYVDEDRDGYGTPDVSVVEACELADGYSANNQDCDDTDETIYPGAEEIVGDDIDQDCDGYDETEGGGGGGGGGGGADSGTVEDIDTGEPGIDDTAGGKDLKEDGEAETGCRGTAVTWSFALLLVPMLRRRRQAQV